MSMKKIARPVVTIGSLLESRMAFNYDDLTLVPRVVSTLHHRADARPEVQLGPFQLTLPLVGSPMPDVCGETMCRVLAQEGTMGILHRFHSIENQQREFEQVHHLNATNVLAVGAAVSSVCCWLSILLPGYSKWRTYASKAGYGMDSRASIRYIPSCWKCCLC